MAALSNSREPFKLLTRCAVMFGLGVLSLLGVARGAIQFDVFLGYDGMVPEASWMPVICEIKNDAPTFSGTVELTGGNLSAGQTIRTTLELPTGTLKRLSLPLFSTAKYGSSWDVRLLPNLADAVPLLRAEDVLVLGLPVNAVLAQRFHLPTVDPAEFPEMVRIQIEKALPFSADEVTTDFEVIEQNESGSVVSAIAVRNEQLAQLAGGIGGQLRHTAHKVSQGGVQALGIHNVHDKHWSHTVQCPVAARVVEAGRSLLLAQVHAARHHQFTVGCCHGVEQLQFTAVQTHVIHGDRQPRQVLRDPVQ